MSEQVVRLRLSEANSRNAELRREVQEEMKRGDYFEKALLAAEAHHAHHHPDCGGFLKVSAPKGGKR